MPVDYANYPPNWKVISDRIRFERAGGRCECRGECGVSHDLEIVTTFDGRKIPTHRCTQRHGEPASLSNGAVVLTVAHLCHDSHCADEDHLLAMCQACHLRLDAARHARNAARTRRQKRVDAGQLALIKEEL